MSRPRPQNSPNACPSRCGRSPESRTTSAGRGSPTARRCSVTSTPTCGTRLTTAPCACWPACRTRRWSVWRRTSPSWRAPRPWPRLSTPTSPGRSARGWTRSTRSRSCAPSSACTSRCRSTPAASVCWPVTSSRHPATWPCRWWPWACSTSTATSSSGWTHPAGSTSRGSPRTPPACQSCRSAQGAPSRATTAAAPTASCTSRSRSVAARSGLGCGDSRSAVSRCSCSTPTSTATAPRTAGRPRGSTTRTLTSASRSTRRSASAPSACWTTSVSSQPRST